MYKVLIVDDEKIVRKGMKSMINWESCGFVVVDEAANGKQGFERFLFHNPELVVTDMHMPVEDGVTLIRNIQESGVDTEILVLSSYDDFVYVKESLKLGAYDYLLKLEMEPKALEAMLRNLYQRIDEKQAHQKEVSATLEHQIDKDAHVYVQKIQEIVAKRYASELVVPDIANELRLTPNYVSHLFKAETGESFKHYLTQVRIEQAQSLLKNTTHNISEVAALVGYDNERYFSRVFKGVVGVTPSEYRRR